VAGVEGPPEKRTLMYEPVSWFLIRVVVFVALVVLYLLIFEKPIRD
jgi:hypothetical protein